MLATILRSLASSLTLAILVAGCSKSEPAAPPPPPPSPATPQPQAAAEPLTAEGVFKTRCATCHGDKGHGDGPAAVALNPKPRNYSDAEWQKTVTDEQLKKTIVGGGAAVGKSPLMVPNPDLAGNEEVLNGLVKIIRSFAQPS